MKELILLGGGGHCRSVIDVIEKENQFKIIGILDVEEKVGECVLGYPIMGTDKTLKDLNSPDRFFFITVGHIYNNNKRVELFKSLRQLKLNIATIISPLAYISKHAKVGEGTIVMHGSIVNAGATVGYNCILNTKSLIEHDAIIEDQCHISTSATINGGTHVKENSFVGSHCTTKEYTQLKGFYKAGQIIK